MAPPTEQAARARIDAILANCGWDIQDPQAVNLASRVGVAVREFPLKHGYGTAA